MGIVNIHLVAEQDGLTVIDTGLRGMHSPVLRAARALGMPIARIALTHAHSDHIGSLDALVAAAPGVEVIISERETPLLAADKQLQDDEPADRVRGAFPGATTTPARTVHDGDEVGSLRVIATPGHTPGHISFLDIRDGTLFCGDVFTAIGSLTTSAVIAWRFPLAGMFTWNRQLELASARTLLALNPTRLAPGHGPIIEAPTTAMSRAIATAASRQ